MNKHRYFINSETKELRHEIVEWINRDEKDGRERELGFALRIQDSPIDMTILEKYYIEDGDYRGLVIPDDHIYWGIYEMPLQKGFKEISEEEYTKLSSAQVSLTKDTMMFSAGAESKEFVKAMIGDL